MNESMNLQENQQDLQQTDESNRSNTSKQEASGQQASGRLNEDNLPQEVRESLPQEAQKIFMAAYNSVIDGSDRETAMQVAWQTIRNNDNFAQNEEGKWYRLPENSGKHNPLGNPTAS